MLTNYVQGYERKTKGGHRLDIILTRTQRIEAIKLWWTKRMEAEIRHICNLTKADTKLLTHHWNQPYRGTGTSVFYWLLGLGVFVRQLA